MCDILFIALMLFFPAFSAFICWLFIKDVFSTIAAKIRGEKNTTVLTPWQMFYHIVIGVTAAAVSAWWLIEFSLFLFYEDY